MPKKDKRIDAYISKRAAYAKPVLEHLRKLIHKGCPEADETIKWGMPSFDYKGPLCSFAAFKEHAVFGFWKAAIMKDKDVLLNSETRTAMGNLGRIRSMKDLPKDEVILEWIKEAKKLNDDEIKLPKDKPKHPKKEIPMPADLKRALTANKKAKEVYDKFSPSHKREYLEWITEAKTDETRNRRIETTIEWLKEGKPRNWKYMKR
jgi:uncharacterized protein YdeI (YjbR/CyaY-like superfamily)